MSASPFTAEHVAEWASFGPKLKSKGKPTPEQLVVSNERKAKRTEMKKRLVVELQDPHWTETKIEKQLDLLAEERAQAANRPEYLGGPSGTRDFYPPEMKIHNWLFGNFRETAKSFGFQEYDAPVLEHVELYERKAGEEILGQMNCRQDFRKTASLWMYRRFDAKSQEECKSKLQARRPDWCKANGICGTR